MTLEVQRVLKCDGCGTTRVSDTEKAGLMRAKAKLDGWHRADDNTHDLCPDCWTVRRAAPRPPVVRVQRKGESHPLAKLNEQSVRDIRELAAEGVTMTLLACWYQVDHSTIRNVVKKRTWQHVEDSPSATTSSENSTDS